ncbi:hypothetical protein K466DRAFT_240856 [Polyporus arcularius HHB13444]|uniref:Uncharacterized protein n=1 Tax=Polyporus arcularius HHB13444 TaxID=1314778 RepID=A0A5C3PR16_9APHY|nr:hypothetical protein K466DRAFT_240856 [Polyporus arcularius HHB13444]
MREEEVRVTALGTADVRRFIECGGLGRADKVFVRVVQVGEVASARACPCPCTALGSVKGKSHNNRS